ncbi:hypothetical protein [Nonomuraea salmonea]
MRPRACRIAAYRRPRGRASLLSAESSASCATKIRDSSAGASPRPPKYGR